MCAAGRPFRQSGATGCKLIRCRRCPSCWQLRLIRRTSAPCCAPDPALPLSDAVEERLNQYGEAAAIWRLDDSPACGVQIPQSLIRQPAEAPQKSGGSSLAYLLLDRLSAPRAGTWRATWGCWRPDILRIFYPCRRLGRKRAVLRQAGPRGDRSWFSLAGAGVSICASAAAAASARLCWLD